MTDPLGTKDGYMLFAVGTNGLRHAVERAVAAYERVQGRKPPRAFVPRHPPEQLVVDMALQGVMLEVHPERLPFVRVGPVGR